MDGHAVNAVNVVAVVAVEATSPKDTIEPTAVHDGPWWSMVEGGMGRMGKWDDEEKGDMKRRAVSRESRNA